MKAPKNSEVLHFIKEYGVICVIVLVALSVAYHITIGVIEAVKQPCTLSDLHTGDKLQVDGTEFTIGEINNWDSLGRGSIDLYVPGKGK